MAQKLWFSPRLTILSDGTESLWIGTRHGLVRFDGGSFKQITTRHGLPDDDIRQIVLDRAYDLRTAEGPG
jgi:ligand-binding sensor domain-containing protein